MTMIKRADGSYSKRGLWDNIRAKKGSGNKPTAAMLKQEKKIKANTGKGKKYPDGKGKKNVVYVPDEETLKLEQQARTDSTSSYQESEQLRAKIAQESADYEASMEKLEGMSDDEYLEKGDAVEEENNRINDDSRANAKRLLNKTPNKYREKGIEPSGSVTSSYLGKTMSFPTYSPPTTTVELKKKEEEKKIEEKKVEEKKKEKPVVVAEPIVSPKPIVKKAPVVVKPVEKKEEPKVDYKGKIKYIPDANGPAKYFFVDGSGRSIPLPEHEAKRRQKVDNTEIIKVMKNKKMPMGIKYNSGRKGQYSYKKGRKKYALGALAGLAGKAAGAVGGAGGASGIMSKLGGAGAKGGGLLGKASSVADTGAVGDGSLSGKMAKGFGATQGILDKASEVTSFMGQYGASGNEKANKISGILNSSSSVAGTMEDTLLKKEEKQKEKLGGMGNAIKKGAGGVETPEQEFKKEGMFSFGKGNKKMPMGMKYGGGKGKKGKKNIAIDAETGKPVKLKKKMFKGEYKDSMQEDKEKDQNRKLSNQNDFDFEKEDNKFPGGRKSKAKKKNYAIDAKTGKPIKLKKSMFKGKYKNTMESDKEKDQKGNLSNQDADYDQFASGRKGKGIVIKNKKVREYR